MQILKTRIKGYPGIWRIHKTINPRHLQRARIWMMKKLIDTDGSYDYRLDTLWKKALMKNPVKQNILIDIDKQDVNLIHKVRHILTENNIDIVECNYSPNGYHIVCPIFDTRLIQNIEDVEYKRDGYIFIDKIEIGRDDKNE